MFTAELKTEEKADKQKSMEAQKQRAEERAKDPFAKLDDALSGVFVSLGRGLGQTMKDIGETIQKGAQMAANGVVTAGTLVVGGVSWLIDEAAALGKSAMDTVSSWMDDEGINKNGNAKEKIDVKERIIKNPSDKINKKDVGTSLKNLTDLAQQNAGGSKYVREELRKALSKIPGGENLDVDKVLEKSCTSLSVWVALKQAGANVGEYGEFYAEQVKKGNISAENASVNKITELANSYKIDGKSPEVGFTRDFDKYEKLLKSGEVTNGVVLFEKSKDKYHAVNVFSSNEGTKISDVSYRTHGKLASGIVDKENYRWLFYVKKRGK